MRAFAEFVMRGRMQATLGVAGSIAVPLLFWLGAAGGGLDPRHPPSQIGL